MGKSHLQFGICYCCQYYYFVIKTHSSFSEMSLPGIEWMLMYIYVNISILIVMTMDITCATLADQIHVITIYLNDS